MCRSGSSGRACGASCRISSRLYGRGANGTTGASFPALASRRERSSPPRIEFSPEHWWERALFAAIGWRLFTSAMHALAEAPPDLTAPERAELHRRLGARLLRHLRVRLTIEGLGNLPRAPHIIVALHEGIADGLILSQLPVCMRFVARDEVFDWPHIGPAIARMGHLPIDPERGATAYRRLLAQARATLGAGLHLVLFPQGTLLGIETAFRAGAFRVARALRAPLLPIVITGAHRIWEHPFSARLRYGAQAAVVILPSLAMEEVCERDPDELRLELQRRMKAIALSGRVPQPRHYVPSRDGFWDGFAFEIDEDFAAVHGEVASHRMERNVER